VGEGEEAGERVTKQFPRVFPLLPHARTAPHRSFIPWISDRLNDIRQHKTAERQRDPKLFPRGTRRSELVLSRCWRIMVFPI
jgi:hypothetical protein